MNDVPAAASGALLQPVAARRRAKYGNFPRIAANFDGPDTDRRANYLMLQRILEQAGRLLPESKRFPTERRLRGWLEQQRLDRADYAVVSFGKSGRTWLRVMISRIYQRRHGLSDELIEYSNYHRANPALPRVLFTHDNYLRDYTGHGGGKAAFTKKPVLLLVRHPADITMSQYFQWKHRMRPHKVLLNQYPPVDDSVTPNSTS